jgi:hypothetical protein
VFLKRCVPPKRSTQRYNPEDQQWHLQPREKLKSHTVTFMILDRRRVRKKILNCPAEFSLKSISIRSNIADPDGRAVTGIVGSSPDRGMDVCPRIYVLCCPVSIEAFATGWSLVQRCPVKFLKWITDLRCEAAKVLTRTVELQMMNEQCQLLDLWSFFITDWHTYTNAHISVKMQ